jgi:hypothetical protein
MYKKRQKFLLEMRIIRLKRMKFTSFYQNIINVEIINFLRNSNKSIFEKLFIQAADLQAHARVQNSTTMC